MRKLLLFFALLFVSVGAWAGPAEGFEMKKEDIGRWFAQADASLTPEKVIYIEVTDQAGALKAALDELTLILGGSTDKPHYAEYRTALDAASDGATNFIADNRLIVKIVYTGNNGSLTLSNDDVAALNAVTVPTIDLQDLKPASVFTLSNSNVKNLILPDEWTMAQVQAAATGCSNLNAALSIGTDVGAGEHADGTPVTGIGKSFVAYVNKPGTLYQCTRRLGYLDHNNDKVGSVNPYTWALSNVKLLTITGTPSARDFNGTAANGAVKFDPDGHLVFDREADETSTDKDAGIGGTRVLLGDNMSGALTGANLVKLDLGNAIITDANCSDLTISWSYSCVATSLKEIVFPTTPLLKTLPADCLNGDYSLLEELCIPGNIKVLKTRSCYISINKLRHVWTTGTTENMVYDNGAYLVVYPDQFDEDGTIKPDPVDHYGHAPLDDATWNAGIGPGGDEGGVGRYGTITLPEGLELIESHNFTARSVSDVYVLAQKAPECHVDAFSTIMYLSNNTVATDYITQLKMVTRKAYAQSLPKGEYTTFLHYPRECGTPDIQRYTDPTREYSVATTMRDGKGNIIYFPNQSEFNRAYLQGTTGYVWFAWDSERIPDNGDNGDANSFKNCNPGTLTSHTTAAQQQANDFYNANTMTDPDKTDRSFYDVRLGTDGQPVLNKPADLDWYYETIWEGTKLYPEMVTTNTEQVIGQVQKQDAQGHLLFVPGDCNFIQDYEYVKQDDGELVWVINVTEDTNGPKVKDYDYQAVTDGIYYRPMVKENQKDASQWQKYWYIGYKEDPNGEYVNGNGNWIDFATARDWGLDPDNMTHYSRGWTQMSSFDSNTFYNNDMYYLSDAYAIWSEDVTDIIAGVNETRYNKVYKDSYRDYNASTDAGETRYNVDDQGLQAWDESFEGQGYDRYHKQYIEHAYREFDSSKDDPNETRYCRDMEDVYAVVKGKQNDYRGWHQFVLTAYATNDDRPFTPVKFYQTDNDWWTVCLPYDLKYNDMIRFFGNGEGKIPYLSKLRYVVRDYDKEKITLMFSKNLMEYKEVITNVETTDDFVHGVINDETKYTDAELADNPIILHKGVPYLIKPNIDVSAGRSFDVFKTTNDDLYERLIDAQNVPGGALESYIYKGEYTVPAYVIGENAPEATVDSRDFPHQMGPTFSYSSNDQITYGKQKVSARISSEFSYTFVGSFFLSVLPQNCYFLGWDSKKKCAAFWYNKVAKLDEYAWNNQTGVICANFNEDETMLIDPATDIKDPAKWSITSVASDDLTPKTTNSTGNAKSYGMDWGGSVDVVVSGIGSIYSDKVMNKAENADVVYDMQGVRMNQPLNRLPKGVYIVNGKKYIVK